MDFFYPNFTPAQMETVTESLRNEVDTKHIVVTGGATFAQSLLRLDQRHSIRASSPFPSLPVGKKWGWSTGK
jgi:hypothetical protein